MLLAEDFFSQVCCYLIPAGVTFDQLMDFLLGLERWRCLEIDNVKINKLYIQKDASNSVKQNSV